MPTKSEELESVLNALYKESNNKGRLHKDTIEKYVDKTNILLKDMPPQYQENSKSMMKEAAKIVFNNKSANQTTLKGRENLNKKIKKLQTFIEKEGKAKDKVSLAQKAAQKASKVFKYLKSVVKPSPRIPSTRHSSRSSQKDRGR